MNIDVERDRSLPYSKRPLSCKLGFHEYDAIYDGLFYYLGCKKCYKKHWIFK